MGTLAKAVYAIMGTELVELRTAASPPKAIVSQLTRTLIATKKMIVFNGPEDFVGHQVLKGEKYTKVFRQVYFMGGTVVGYMPLYKFARAFGKYLKRDTILALNPTASTLVRSPKWRKQNLIA